MAQWFEDTKEGILLCSEFLKKGEIVCFPTETVYGMGASIYNKEAISRIFLLKGRSATNPLIIHTFDSSEALKLTHMASAEEILFDVLAKQFWPGPLTLVCTKHPTVSSIVTAGSSFVGLRVPHHPTALELLRTCGFPLAAPSANRSGHVSPTSAQHVWDDFKDQHVSILRSDIIGQWGLESTVAMIQGPNKVAILRPGCIEPKDIRELFLSKDMDIQVEFLPLLKKTVQNAHPQQAPGQELKHYAPRQECFVFVEEDSSVKEQFVAISELKINEMSKTFLIDFNEKLLFLKDQCFGYLDLSVQGNFYEAAKNFFSFLREAEKKIGISKIVIAWPSQKSLQVGGAEKIFWPLADRIFRAASGFGVFIR